MIGQNNPEPYAKGQYWVICEPEHYQDVVESLREIEVGGQRLAPKVSQFKGSGTIGLIFPEAEGMSSELEQRIKDHLASIPYVARVEPVANYSAQKNE